MGRERAAILCAHDAPRGVLDRGGTAAPALARAEDPLRTGGRVGRDYAAAGFLGAAVPRARPGLLAGSRLRRTLTQREADARG